MKTVRLIYQKTGRAKYISHLDLNRLMQRVLKRTRLPVWYTEGFNPHAFVTFALPLSLGYESRYDCMDFRILNDDLRNDQMLQVLRRALPPDIQALEVIDPVLKAKEVAFAAFELELTCDTDTAAQLMAFLQSEHIPVGKRSKNKEPTIVDIKPKIRQMEMTPTGDGLQIRLLLPAGPVENINPALLLEAAENSGCVFDVRSVVREMLYDKNMNIFR